MDITRTVETAARIDKVFAFPSDFTTTEEWDPGTVQTTRIVGNGGTKVDNERFALVGEGKTVTATGDEAEEGMKTALDKL